MGLLQRIAAALRAQPAPAHEPGYRLIELATGRVMGRSHDREVAFGLLRDAEAQGHAWEALDLLDPSGQSLMIREHERAVDHALGVPVTYHHTLEEARAADGWVILDGDWGGQVYLTSPASLVRIDHNGLKTLLHEIDLESWGGQEEASLSINFRVGAHGDVVGGGMGGGRLDRASPWIHPELVQLGLSDAINAVLAGEIGNLPAAPTIIAPERLEALGRALDEEDPRLRSSIAPRPDEEYDGGMGMMELLGPPPIGREWYAATIHRALENVRPNSARATILRWREEAQAKQG